MGGTLLVMALLCVPPMLSAGEKEVQVRWEELSGLVERRDVEMVLTNGVHVRGRAERVLAEALEVRVKKTSDAAVIPQGLTPIPRGLVSAMTLRWKTRWARILLPVGLLFSLPYFLFLGLQIDSDDLGGPRAV